MPKFAKKQNKLKKVETFTFKKISLKCKFFVIFFCLFKTLECFRVNISIDIESVILVIHSFVQHSFNTILIFSSLLLFEFFYYIFCLENKRKNIKTIQNNTYVIAFMLSLKFSWFSNSHLILQHIECKFYLIFFVLYKL